MDTDQILRKLKLAADTLENIRTYEIDPSDNLIDRYTSLRLHNKRQAGDTLVEIGAIKVVDGRAVFVGVE